MTPFGLKNIHHDDEYGVCSRCGGELYRYDKAYYINEDLVCTDCVTDEEAEFFYAETMDERLEDAYSIYMEERESLYDNPIA